MAEINWTTDEFGTRVFTHGPWTVTHYTVNPRVDVAHIYEDIEVDVDEDEIAVFGERRTPYSTHGVRVHIPFIVLRAIMEAVEANRG